MNILFLTQFFDTTQGGGEVVFYSIAKQLAKKGHCIHVICHNLDCRKKCNDLPPNLKICDVNPPVKFAGGLPISPWNSLLFFINSLRCGLKLIKTDHIDIIHANTYVPVFIGVLLSKLTKRPLFMTVHDVALTNGLSFWKKWMKQYNASCFHYLVGYLVELLTVKSPAFQVVTVSETSREDILAVRKKSSVSVVPNGLDISSYNVDLSEISYDDEIVFIGRAVYYKNLEVILSAMKKIVKKVPNAHLVVIGCGPMSSSWEQLAKDYGIYENVVFKGHISHEEKLSILKRAKVLVLPSTWEGFGMVLLEAWALRKPVVVSNVRPLTDIVTHGKDGFYAHPFISDDWATCLEDLLTKKDLAKKMGESGYGKLLNNFTLLQTVERLESLYNKTYKNY